MPIVVGAIIADSLAQPRRVLAARRAHSHPFRGRWEFPGGKVEPGETAEEALVREVQEELDVTIMLGDELTPTGEAWQLISTQLTLRLFWAEIFVGTPTLWQSHDEMRWLDAADLMTVNWLDADRAALPAVLAELTSGAEPVRPEEVAPSPENLAPSPENLAPSPENLAPSPENLAPSPENLAPSGEELVPSWEELAPQHETPDTVAEPAEQPSSRRPKISRRFPRR